MQEEFVNPGSRAKHANELRLKSKSLARRQIGKLFAIKLKQRALFYVAMSVKDWNLFFWLTKPYSVC